LKTRSKSSLIDSLRQLKPEPRRQFIYNELTAEQAHALLYDWEAWARPEQLPPAGDWMTWLIVAGRGWGKNRTAAETIRHFIEAGETRKMLLVSKNPQDAREDMIEEERSGILAIMPPSLQPDWQPGNKRLVWPDGTLAHVRTGAKPDNIRGGGYDLVWMDELAAWDYPRKTYDNIQFACRQSDPRQIITTTPKPILIMEELKEQAKESSDVVFTTGTTWENVDNLSDKFMNTVVARYRNTRMGRQELEAEILTDNPDALWDHEIIKYKPKEELIKNGHLINFERVAVGVDPATTNKTESDETGIVVAGRRGDQFYLLDDLSGRYSPHGWASKAIKAFHTYQADRIVAEKNQGGDMVKTTIQDMERVPVKLVNASRGKDVRAEPISAIYERGRAYHLDDPEDKDKFEELERQYTTWVPGENSPDRLDAAVWALTFLKPKSGGYSGGSPGSH